MNLITNNRIINTFNPFTSIKTTANSVINGVINTAFNGIQKTASYSSGLTNFSKAQELSTSKKVNVCEIAKENMIGMSKMTFWLMVGVGSAYKTTTFLGLTSPSTSIFLGVPETMCDIVTGVAGIAIKYIATPSIKFVAKTAWNSPQIALKGVIAITIVYSIFELFKFKEKNEEKPELTLEKKLNEMGTYEQILKNNQKKSAISTVLQTISKDLKSLNGDYGKEYNSSLDELRVLTKNTGSRKVKMLKQFNEITKKMKDLKEDITEKHGPKFTEKLEYVGKISKKIITVVALTFFFFKV